MRDAPLRAPRIAPCNEAFPASAASPTVVSSEPFKNHSLRDGSTLPSNETRVFTTPAGIVHQPPQGRCWANVEPVFERLRAQGRIWFGAEGDARPRIKNFLSEAKGLRPWSWWPHEEAGHNQEAKKESIALFGDAPFATPKPERLVKCVLEIASDPGDLVLDSFAGSGTTGAVARSLAQPVAIVAAATAAKHADEIATRNCPVTPPDRAGRAEKVGASSGELTPTLSAGIETVLQARSILLARLASRRALREA